MKEDQFVLFKKFADINDAQNLADILNQEGILFELIDNSPKVDVTFTGGNPQEEFLLRLHREDFVKVRDILDDQAEQIMDQIPKDHYIYEFTEEELLDIIKKPDEWSALDYQLSKKLLNDKGIDISESDLEAYRESRNKELSQPDKGDSFWIIFAYISAILGGLIGIFIGYAFWTSKSTSPNGEKFYAYDKVTRAHGRNIFFLGLFTFATLFVVFALS